MIWCTLRVFLYCLRGAFYCTYSYIYRCINIGIHTRGRVGVLISFPSFKAVVVILMQLVTCYVQHARYVKHGNAYGLHKLCINKIHLTSVNPLCLPAGRPTSIKNYFSFLYRITPIASPTPHDIVPTYRTTHSTRPTSHTLYLTTHILCPDTYPHNTPKTPIQTFRHSLENH